MSPKTKQWLGLAIAIIGGVLGLPFFLFAPLSVVNSTGEEGVWSNFVSLLFACGLFLFAFNYGVRLRRRGKAELEAMSSIPVDRGELSFTNAITLNEYRRVMLTLLFINPIIIYLMFIGISILTLSLTSGEGGQTFWFGLLPFILPFSVLVSATRAYNRTPNIKQQQEVTVTVDGIEVKGPAFNTNMRWSGIVRVREFSHWFFLHTGPHVMIILSKKSMDVAKFRAIVRAVPGVIRDLRRS
jgi:hypothetical protein